MFPLNAMTHMRFYQTPLLANGSHIFTINVTSLLPTFYIDFLTVEVESSSIVDDSDPHITYDGDQLPSWMQEEYTHTNHIIPPSGEGNA